MTNRLNSGNKTVVNYTFIVTTVLILLSAALITFIQYYTQQTENAIREDASRITT